MKRLTKIFVMILSAGILFSFCGCTDIIDKAFSPSEIKDGFSDKWLKTLSDEYSITIPESAAYLKGYYEPGQDFSVHMLFTVDAADFDGMVGDDWSEDAKDHTFGDEWYTDLTDLKLSHYYVYTKQYTVLFYSDADKDNKITCAFVGWRP
ncbi:hypothetical protein OBV_42400 [Oscillibacter valericigenes Sjm18-20]|nr:hypothetical protein OBV_42400 [Oscillibacter valericigenes Sjm18-20]